MSRILFCVLFLLLIIYGVRGVEFKQERAKVIYVNPKYAKDVAMFTYRESRNSPYLSTLNITSLVPFADNVTIRIEFINPKLHALPIRFDFKSCGSFKLKWVSDWLQAYSDIPMVCPIPPASYHVSRFEIPPKNFPFQFNNIDYSGKTTVFITGTKEKICELTLELRFMSKHG